MTKTPNTDDLERRIAKIELRNKRVEADKAWEGSTTRTIMLFLVSYVAVAVYFIATNEESPLITALEPAAGVFLSGFVFGRIKKYWIRKYKS